MRGGVGRMTILGENENLSQWGKGGVCPINLTLKVYGDSFDEFLHFLKCHINDREFVIITKIITLFRG